MSTGCEWEHCLAGFETFLHTSWVAAVLGEVVDHVSSRCIGTMVISGFIIILVCNWGG